jgi:hypothetical protein
MPIFSLHAFFFWQRKFAPTLTLLFPQLVAYTRFMASSLREGRGKTTAEVLAAITEKYNRLVHGMTKLEITTYRQNLNTYQVENLLPS